MGKTQEQAAPDEPDRDPAATEREPQEKQVPSSKRPKHLPRPTRR